ncbi:MAG: peptidylprolyl isomerase [Oscillospiraceae bacterium]|nr:peptidylprolyl isomerase [Oscillospiraceae bacterium]
MSRKHTVRAGAGFILSLLLASCSPAPAAFIGGERVTRDEARFVMHLTEERYALYAGDEADRDGSVLREMTLRALTTARVLKDKTALYDCPLTADDEAWLALVMAEEESAAGGAAAFEARLESLGGTRELYRLHQYEVLLMEINLTDRLFGPGGPYEPDSAALEAFVETATARCAYVYLSLTGGDGLRLTGEDRDRLLSVAEAIRRQAEREPEAFPELVAAHGQDYGMSLNPEGMTIPTDYHGDVFRAALEALAPGGLSPVVETRDGLYVIARLEPDPDYLQNYRAEAEDACRQFTRAALMEQWREEIGAETFKAFETLTAGR